MSDYKYWLTAFLMPVFAVGMAVYISEVLASELSSGGDAVALDSADWIPEEYGWNIPVEINSTGVDSDPMVWLNDIDTRLDDVPVNITVVENIDEYYLSNYNETGPRAAGFVVNSLNSTARILDVTVLYNFTSNAVVPIMTSRMLEAFSRHVTGDTEWTFDLLSHPWPSTILAQVLVFIAPLVIVYGFANVGPSYGIGIVREREIKLKSTLLANSTAVRHYWVASLIADWVTYMISAMFSVVLMYVGGLSFAVETHPVGLFLLFMLYGPAIIANAYVLSFFFDKAETAQRWLPLVNTCSMIVPAVAILVLGVLLGPIFLILLFVLLPPAALIVGVMAMASNAASGTPLATLGDVFSFTRGLSLVYLALLLSMAFYWFVVYYIDTFRRGQLAMAEALAPSVNVRQAAEEAMSLYYSEDDPPAPPVPPSPSTSPALPPSPRGFSPTPPTPATPAVAAVAAGPVMEDKDVAAERLKLAALEPKELMKTPAVVPKDGDRMMTVMDLWKEYKAKTEDETDKLAVKGVSLSIGAGEVFALLGPNGAGKTSLLSVLTGENSPSAGAAFIRGKNVVTYLDSAWEDTGFCPQHDALYDSLTGRQHLRMTAALRGVSKADMEATVNEAIETMQLQEHADKKSKEYSGGTKRKLSVAMAFIGDPSVVFLDEPSTGMDPAVRRALWDVILSKRPGRVILLTTHSMEEAEALASRIGIMVRGTLRCLGTSQHLKRRFGGGYEINVSCDVNRTDDVEAWIKKSFPSATKQSAFFGAVKYELAPEKSRSGDLADIFSKLEEGRSSGELGIKDYSASSPTLESVFVAFARKQEEEELAEELAKPPKKNPGGS